MGCARPGPAVRTITRFDPSPFKSHVAGEVDDFHPADYLEERRARRLDRFSQFTVAATRLALGDARLDLAKEDRDRVGVMMGTALGGVAQAEEQHQRYIRGGVRDVDPALALKVFVGASSCNVAIEFGCTGPNSTNGMSCASGTIAIGDGFRCIVRGEADIMLAGGVEAPLAPLTFGAFAIIRAMSTRNEDPGTASRPFDAGRDGFVMAEGASVLVLEERGRALARGAQDLRRALRLRPDQRRASHDRSPARRAASRPGDVPRPGRRPAEPPENRVHQRPRVVDPAQRSDRDRERSSRSSPTTPIASPFPAPRATTATRWVRAEPSRRQSARWPAAAAGCRPT